MILYTMKQVNYSLIHNVSEEVFLPLVRMVQCLRLHVFSAFIVVVDLNTQHPAAAAGV